MRGVATLSDNPVIQLLKSARGVISDPDRHCKASLFKIGNISSSILKHVKRADKFCAMGAVYRAALVGTCIDRPLVLAALNELSQTVQSYTKRFNSHIARFNDRPETTHQDILDIFDLTIKRLEQDSVQQGLRKLK